MDRNEFFLKVAHALTGCQLVEEALKLYIAEAFELAKKCIGSRMAFRFSGENYEDASLERLIDVFKRLSDNSTLVKDLGQFKRERNFLSHRGVTHCLDPAGQFSDPDAIAFQKRLDGIQHEAERLQSTIWEEAQKFRGHLDFEILQDES